MVTIQEQIQGSLLKPGRSGGTMPMSGLSPQAVVGTGGANCVLSAIEILGAKPTLCPTPWPIIYKTKVTGPPYVMYPVGNRAYAISSYWATGTALFMQTPDGQILALKKDGAVRIYRPKRHIVVSSNPRVKNLVRARTKLDNLSKRLRGAIGARAVSSGRGKKR